MQDSNSRKFKMEAIVVRMMRATFYFSALVRIENKHAQRAIIYRVYSNFFQKLFPLSSVIGQYFFAQCEIIFRYNQVNA